MNPLNELFRCNTTNKMNKPNSINVLNSKNSTTINLNESFKYFENNNSLFANKIKKKSIIFSFTFRYIKIEIIEQRRFIID